MKKKFSAYRIAYDSILIAVCFALGYASIDFGFFKLTFESFPILLGGLLFGPIDGLLIGFIGTFLSQMVHYSIDASTVFWVIPYAVTGLAVGFYAHVRHYYMNRKELVIASVAGSLCTTVLNLLALYFCNVYLFGLTKETTLASIVASLPVKLAVCLVKGFAFGFVMMPLLQAIHKLTKRFQQTR